MTLRLEIVRVKEPCGETGVAALPGHMPWPSYEIPSDCGFCPAGCSCQSHVLVNLRRAGLRSSPAALADAARPRPGLCSCSPSGHLSAASL